ncbi:hypothetical protein ES703_15526 [subsurface metagenome]
MRRKKPKRNRSRTTIVIEPTTFDTLWYAKDRFGKLVGGKTTWGSFLEQAVLHLEADVLMPSVKATRYNPYVYVAECPKCGIEEYPLMGNYGTDDNPKGRRRRRTAWKVKCKKCGVEYIALG